jgi:hypothetical protein
MCIHPVFGSIITTLNPIYLESQERFSMRRRATFFVLVISASTSVFAQTYYKSSANFFDKWEARATATQALQPKWMVPVVSPYPMLIQVFRSDFSRQISSIHVTTWNLGTSRGLNLIPFARTEVDILVPPFLAHSDKTPDGFGDFSFTGKYRILSANEKKGNYLFSGSLTTAIPTGSYKNGATNATITPVITGGKGFGKFDTIVAIGSALPTGNTATIGRTLTSNVVLQYHVQKYIWPEVEINITAWYGGSKDGKVQTLLTPGMMFGKYSPRSKGDPSSRLGLAAGAGFQTSATTYHTYNHNLVFTGRILF